MNLAFKEICVCAAGWAAFIVVGQTVRAQNSKADSGPVAARQVLNFNADWKFAKGEAIGAEAPSFNDSGWQAVRLPHDWAIAGPFDPNIDGFAGKLPWQGVGWYRKAFTIDGFGNVVVRPASHGLDRRLDGAERSHDQDLDLGPLLLQPANKFHASHARHLEIGENEISRTRLKLLQRFFGACRPADVIVPLLEKRHQGFANV